MWCGMPLTVVMDGGLVVLGGFEEGLDGGPELVVLGAFADYVAFGF